MLGCTWYDESVDVWAFGMTALTVLRPGLQPAVQLDDSDSELALMAAIFKSFGTPAPEILEEWAGRSLGMGFREYDRLPDSQLLPGIEDNTALLQTVLSCLNYRRDERPTSAKLVELLKA